MSIHPTAIVSNKASIGANCTIGAFAVVDENVTIGNDCVIAPRVHIYPNTLMGNDCRIYDGAIVGSDPQDLKYDGSNTYLEIGDRVKIREYCTINRSVSSDQPTQIKDDVLLMAYCHVGHDCIIHESAVLANGVQLGGHVEIGKNSVIGGYTAVHQFSIVGAYTFVGGTLKIDRHVPPFSKALGEPLVWAGINTIGLKRAEIESELSELKSIFKNKFSDGVNWSELSLDSLKNPIVQKEFQNFIRKASGKILSRRAV
jgi:UDP-N-acetylglucosamine acyltransferase